MRRFPNKLTTPPVVEVKGKRGGFPFVQPETGAPFAHNTWAELLQEVYKHRQGMGLDLADGWLDRFEDEFCRQNPHLGCQDDQIPATFDTPLAIAGRALWGELHAFTEQYPDAPTEDDVSRAKYWLANWRERIPRFGGCSCREDWGKLEANYPPDYTSREAFVRWGSVAHDAISKKLGKKLFRPEWFESASLGGF